MQAYSNPKRQSDPYALPDVEVWQEPIAEVHCRCGEYEVPHDTAFVTDEVYCPSCERPASATATTRQAWWWWTCFPGCLPDSSPFGPFKTRADALADAQENAADEDEDDEDAPVFEVIVGNIGTVYSGPDEAQARTTFTSYVTDSKASYGRAAGEDVYLMRDGELADEYQGTNDDEDA